MKELNIQSVIRKKVYKRKFKPSKIEANILNRNFKSNKPLEKICMDITYIPIGKKFIYLNAAKDLFNGEIVEYDISTRIDNVLVQNTLKQLNRMNLDENCILHQRKLLNVLIKVIVLSLNQMELYSLCLIGVTIGILHILKVSLVI